MYLGCHNPEIRNGLFVGRGFSEYPSDEVLCQLSDRGEGNVRVTAWQLEFTEQDCCAMLPP